MDITSSKQVRRIALGILRHMPKTRQLARRAYWKYRGRQYDSLSCSKETQGNVVLFESFMGRSYSCSPRAIYEALVANPTFDDYEIYWSVKPDCLNQFKANDGLSRAIVVEKGSKEYFDALARAKYWVTNSRSEEYVNPKPDQIYLQCWHGTPLKRLGHDIEIETTNALNTSRELATRYSVESSKWSYLVTPSPYTTECLLSAFGLGEKWRSNILEVGYPRNDRVCLYANDAEYINEIKIRLGIPVDKKLLLYAPTWRDNEYKAGVGYVQDTLIDFDLLQSTISPEWAILFRPHYFIANEFDFSKYEGFVYDASKVSDINDLYLVADALMTDYSSVFFDYANTGRPLLFFWPDYEEYASDIRGFYLDPQDLPGPHCFTSEEVVKAILEIPEYEKQHGQSYLEFQQKFCPKDDGHSAERVVEAVFKNNQE